MIGGVRARLPDSPLSRADWPWLGWPLAVGLVVAGLYIWSNSYPAYGAGLYTLTADTIRANGYALPETVPHYSAEGVPVAYPPLVFYVLAAARDLGATTFATAMVGPPLLTVAALVPAYLLGREIADDRRAGTAVALLVVLNPQTLEWHISAGGLVRAPAFALALSGSYAALRLFRDGKRQWVPGGLLAVALVALTHPTYALFTVVTTLLFWVGYDRSPVGFGRGAVVGVGALVLVTPWLLAVIELHGPVVFSGAAGTHGGVGGGLYRLRQWGPTWALLPVAAAVGLLGTRHRVVGLWTLVVWVLFAQPRFTYAVGAITVVALVAVLARSERLGGVAFDSRTALASLLVLSAVGVAGVGFDFTGSDRTTPEFVDDEDVAAMEWAAAETRPDANFVVLGDAAEWFPVLAERTILVSPWGAEWRGPSMYEPHLNAFKTGSTCGALGCVERAMATVDAEPAYVYVPKGDYTVRGGYRTADGDLVDSFARSDRYQRAFENDGVVIFRRTGES